MPQNRFARLLFLAIVVFALVVIGRNVYRRRLDAALLPAVQQRDVAAVRNLLARGADANVGLSPESRISPAIDTLVIHGYEPGSQLSPQEEDIICLLIAHGAKFHADPNNTSYLYFVCACGSVKVARSLLEHGIDMKFEETRAWPPAKGIITFYNGCRAYPAGYWTTGAGRERLRACRELTRLLHAHGGHMTLWQAAQLNDTSLVGAALDAGTPVNAGEAVSGRKGNGAPAESLTALQLAAESDNLETVRLLLARHANVNVRSPQGHTPLYYARRQNHAAIAALLLRAGGKDE